MAAQCLLPFPLHCGHKSISFPPNWESRRDGWHLLALFEDELPDANGKPAGMCVLTAEAELSIRGSQRHRPHPGAEGVLSRPAVPFEESLRRTCASKASAKPGRPIVRSVLASVTCATIGSVRQASIIAATWSALIRPASVHPEPLLRAVADPRLQGQIDPGHQRCSVGMRLAASH